MGYHLTSHPATCPIHRESKIAAITQLGSRRRDDGRKAHDATAIDLEVPTGFGLRLPRPQRVGKRLTTIRMLLGPRRALRPARSSCSGEAMPARGGVVLPAGWVRWSRGRRSIPTARRMSAARRSLQRLPAIRSHQGGAARTRRPAQTHRGDARFLHADRARPTSTSRRSSLPICRRCDSTRKCCGNSPPNLMLNAVQAMPSGGELTVQASVENHHVVLSLIDTGAGIASDMLPKIFRPFFSTKSKSGGSG